MRYIIMLALVTICLKGQIHAQVINLSYKVILSPVNNSRPSNNCDICTANPITDNEIDEIVDWMNNLMDSLGRGISFNHEILNVGGIGTEISNKYYWAPVFDTINSLELDAINNAVDYSWSENSINIYLSNGSNSGICSFPFGNGSHETILIGRSNIGYFSTHFHEIGHFFSLLHTHRCGGCGSSSCGTVDCADVTTALSDEIDDTLPDSPCCNSIDGLSQFNYNLNYNSLSSQQQSLVDDVFFNVMSYYNNSATTTDRSVLTPLQLDRWVQSMFDYDNREDVIDGLPIYIDDDASCLFNLTCPIGCNGSPLLEYETFECGYGELGNDRNLIVIRDGTYNEVGSNSMILNVECLIVSDGVGSAIIR